MGETQEAMVRHRLSHCTHQLSLESKRAEALRSVDTVSDACPMGMLQQDWLPTGHLGTTNSRDGDA